MHQVTGEFHHPRRLITPPKIFNGKIRAEREERHAQKDSNH